MSKACILNKAREHIDKKSKERKRLQQEITLLRREVESLQTQINNSQDQLPAGGLPLSKARSGNNLLISILSQKYIALKFTYSILLIK